MNEWRDVGVSGSLNTLLTSDEGYNSKTSVYFAVRMWSYGLASSEVAAVLTSRHFQWLANEGNLPAAVSLEDKAQERQKDNILAASGP